MKLFQTPLEPAYPMAFQVISEPACASPITSTWQEFSASNKYRDAKAASAMRDAPSMVQKLLEEEREAVKSALQAVDQHLQLKKKEVAEVQKKFMKEEPMKDPIRTALQMDLRANRHRLAAYTPYYSSPVKQQPQPSPPPSQPQKPIFLEAIYEEDNDPIMLPTSVPTKLDKRVERVRHSAIPRQMTARSRCSVKEKVASAKPRMRTESATVLPPIDTPWSNNHGPSDGCYIGPLNYRWQRVADNYIDSDLRLRSRRRCQGRAYETRLRLGYQDDEETEDESAASTANTSRNHKNNFGIVDRELRISRKRQITFGPPHSTSYSRWFSHISGNGYD